MITLLILLITASIILNIYLLNRGLQYIRSNDELNEYVDAMEIERENTLDKLITLLETMREYDMNGAFEADDEVGGAYKEIINLIETYKNEL
jgi:uncharacterized protein with GYD domain